MSAAPADVIGMRSALCHLSLDVPSVAVDGWLQINATYRPTSDLGRVGLVFVASSTGQSSVRPR